MLDLDWDAQGHARSLHKGTHAKARFGQPGNKLNFSLCAMRLRPASPNHSKLTCRKAARGKKTKSKSAQPTPTLDDLEEGEGRGHRKETEVKFVARWIDLEVGVARNKMSFFYYFRARRGQTLAVV